MQTILSYFSNLFTCICPNLVFLLRYIVFNVPVHASATLSFVNHWFELSSILSQVSYVKIFSQVSNEFFSSSFFGCSLFWRGNIKSSMMRHCDILWKLHCAITSKSPLNMMFNMCNLVLLKNPPMSCIFKKRSPFQSNVPLDLFEEIISSHPRNEKVNGLLAALGWKRKLDWNGSGFEHWSLRGHVSCYPGLSIELGTWAQIWCKFSQNLCVFCHPAVWK